MRIHDRIRFSRPLSDTLWCVQYRCRSAFENVCFDGIYEDSREQPTLSQGRAPANFAEGMAAKNGIFGVSHDLQHFACLASLSYWVAVSIIPQHGYVLFSVLNLAGKLRVDEAEVASLPIVCLRCVFILLRLYLSRILSITQVPRAWKLFSNWKLTGYEWTLIVGETDAPFA